MAKRFIEPPEELSLFGIFSSGQIIAFCLSRSRRFSAAGSCKQVMPHENQNELTFSRALRRVLKRNTKGQVAHENH
jgi:hypothetical protein